MRTGIICGSFKPFTSGHRKLIELASTENENVLVFASLKDRKNDEFEAKIYGEDMEIIWNQYIIPFLPVNVEVVFTQSPVREVYSFLGEMNEIGSPYIYKIYGDPDDIFQNFPTKSRERYFGDLYSSGRIKFIPVPRTNTEDISGSKMRQFLKTGMKREFMYYLPDGPGIEKEKVWSLLYGRFLRKSKPTNRRLTQDFLYGISYDE